MNISIIADKSSEIKIYECRNVKYNHKILNLLQSSSGICRDRNSNLPCEGCFTLVNLGKYILNKYIETNVLKKSIIDLNIVHCFIK